MIVKETRSALCPWGQSYACDPGSIPEMDLSLSLVVALGKHDDSQASQSLGNRSTVFDAEGFPLIVFVAHDTSL